MKTLTTLTLFVSLFTVSSLSAQNFEDIDTEKEASVFPNPLLVGQKLNVKANKEIFGVEVLDIIGKPIGQKKSDNLETKTLSMKLDRCKQGVYIVKIKFQDNKYAIKKLLVKN